MGLRKKHIFLLNNLPADRRKKKPCVLITMGDPSGIGPEVVNKALSSPGIAGLANFTVIGDRWAFEKSKKEPREIQRISGTKSSEFLRNSRGKVKRQKFSFIDLNNVPRKDFKFGKIDARYGRASFEYLELAVKLIKEGKVDCLVTAPVDKEAINKAGIKFSGHTEYLADSFNVKDFVMMLVAQNIRFSLVTRHVALKDVSRNLCIKEILKTIRLTSTALEKFFGIKNPKISVLALNPHASDGGLFGDEEKRIILPAIALAKKEKYSVVGARPADAAIKELIVDKKHDAAIAMYHDQAMIPLKILGENKGVNLTLGLPFIRTTPLHGVAFDIAGKFNASPASIISAIKLSVSCFKNTVR